MKRDEITRLFQSLARSLVAQHRQHECDREEFWIELEAQNFADAINVILYIEA